MEIIDELEPNRRGPLHGAIGYLSRGGTSGFNIAIRTILVEGDRASYQVGGGIVADSDPDRIRGDPGQGPRPARAFWRGRGSADPRLTTGEIIPDAARAGPPTGRSSTAWACSGPPAPDAAVPAASSSLPLARRTGPAASARRLARRRRRPGGLGEGQAASPAREYIRLQNHPSRRPGKPGWTRTTLCMAAGPLPGPMTGPRGPD